MDEKGVIMSTITLVEEPKDFISQGDIFSDINYIMKFKEQSDYVDITELKIPYIIVLSQACDMRGMYELKNNNGKSTKQIISVLVAPIFEKASVQSGQYLADCLQKGILSEKGFNSDEYKLILSDFHYRFHTLQFEASFKSIPESVIDFKQFFTLNIDYLYENIHKRVCSLQPIFKSQVTLKFSNFLSRVAIP